MNLYRQIMFRCSLLVMTAATTWVPPLAMAQCDPLLTAKIVPSDGGGGHYFGKSVALTATSAVVGAYGYGDFAGAAYVYEAATGDFAWQILPSDAEAGDHFGHAVAAEGELAIVGSPRDNVNARMSGSAYIFDLTTGSEVSKLTPNDGNEMDFFGEAVAIHGTTALVGCSWDSDILNNAGSAYLFDAVTGEQTAKLVADDVQLDAAFGTAVALTAKYAIISAPYADADGLSACGAVYVYDLSSGLLQAKLTSDYPTEYSEFGCSVAADGDVLLVGARFDGGAGAAYLFDLYAFELMATIYPDQLRWNDSFGHSVALHANKAVIGAQSADPNGPESGNAFLFDVSIPPMVWQMASLAPDDGSDSDLFGHSVALYGDRTSVGAVWDDDLGSASGSAYLSELNCWSPALVQYEQCPGPFDMIVVGATPYAQIAYLYAWSPGNVKIPFGIPCAGTQLSLNGTVKLGHLTTADHTGMAILNSTVPDGACGRAYVQAIDLTSCLTTNVVLIE